MSIVKFNPFGLFDREKTNYQPIRNLHREIDNLFNNLLNTNVLLDEMSFSPKIDLVEDKSNYKIVAEIPGVDQKNISVELNGNNLIISGKKESVYKKEENNIYHSERSYGEFKRIFTLPDDADGDKIMAKFENGVLEVSMHKNQAKSNKKVIEIK